MQLLTAEQVTALAPDPASVKAGQGLANPGKWVSVGRDERAVWGECQGSGKLPYRTQADMHGPAFHCSCPSRKFPCKHGLGLLFLLAANPARVAEGAPPEWVQEWLAKRDASAEKKAAKAEEAAQPVDPETAARRTASREQRAEKREDRVRAGLAELQTWLGDLARHGLAEMKQRPATFYDHMAARMVDSQAPGIARRLRDLPTHFASGEHWAERVLEEVGLLQCLLHGYSRIESLAPPLQATVRTAIGWTTAEEDLASEAVVRDRWQVVGQTVELQDTIRSQRTWLIGETTRRPALALSFAARNQALDVSLVPDQLIDASLAFFPSSSPLRALVRERHAPPEPLVTPAARATFAEALANTAALAAGDPWLERTPWLVQNVVPLPLENGWGLRDAGGAVAPITPAFGSILELFTICGGQPATICAEWDFRALRPLSVWMDGRFTPLGGQEA